MDTELPVDFAFDWYIDGPCLKFREEVIATATPANRDPNPPWRLALYPRRTPRYEFLASEEACRRYMAGWARRWEAQIRERMAPQVVFSDLGSGASGAPLNTTHPRRKAQRRGGFKG